MPSFAQTWLFWLRTVPFMERCQRRYGDVFRISMLGMESSAWITDPEAIKSLYSRDRENRIAPATKPALEPMFGLRSVFLADGAAHQRKRRLLMPPFHGERMAAWRDRMIAAAEREIDRWPVGTEFPLAPRMSAVTEEVMFEVVFGLGEGERQTGLREALTEMVEASMRPAGVLLGVFKPRTWPRRLPLTPWGRLQRRIDHTHELLGEEIRLAGRTLSLRSARTSSPCSFRPRTRTGAGWGTRSCGDELMSLLLAGAESSATTLTWVFDFLLHRPDALARLRSELEREDETYLEAVLHETMRLRPVPHLTARLLASPFEVGGYRLPAGNTVSIPAYLVHHRADRYPDPEAFRPERFLAQAPDAFAWVPFGRGKRRCVGASFATLEMKSVISTVLRRVVMRAARPELERIKQRNIILTPEHGARVIAERVLPARPPRSESRLQSSRR